MATVLTKVGLPILVDGLRGVVTEPKWVGWGTGAGTASVNDTILFTEAAEARVAGTSSKITGTLANDTWRLIGTMIAASAQTITNAGCFDSSTGGILFIKGNFTGIPLQINWAIEFTFKLRMVENSV